MAITTRQFKFLDGATGHLKSSTVYAGNQVADGDALELALLTIRGNASFAGIDMAGNLISSLKDPVGNQDAATKKFVLDTTAALSQGLTVKPPVRAATTTNLAALSTLLTIDGVTLLAGERVLVKDQSTPAQNGIYVAASGAWARATDMDSSAEAGGGSYVFVNEGTVNGDTAWVVTSPTVMGTLGTDPMTWTQFSGISDIIAGGGLTKTGKVLAVGAGNGISVAADSIAVSPRANYGITVDGNGVAMNIRANYGLLVDANGLYINLAANPGIQFTGGALDLKLKTDAGLDKDANGLFIKLNASGFLGTDVNGLKLQIHGTGGLYDRNANNLGVKCKSGQRLTTDADGLDVVGLPLQFAIDGTPTATTVTAAALDGITGGLLAPGDAQHSHMRGLLTSVGNVAVGGVVTGDPIYKKSDGTWARAVCDGADAAGNVLGASAADVAAGSLAQLVYAGYASIGTGLTFAIGDVVYLGTTAGARYVNYAGIPSNARVIQVGICTTANSAMIIAIRDFGTKP